jgi:hypothetical protein
VGRRPRPWWRHPAAPIAAAAAALVAAVVALVVGGSSDTSTDRQLELAEAVTDTGRDRELGPGDVVVDPSNLAPGDCFDDTTFDEPEAVFVGLITIAACDGAHDLEVAHIEDLEASSSAPYPGELAILERTEELCLTSFDAYVGRDYYESELDFTAYYPSELSWRKHRDRTIVCAVHDPSLEPLDASVAGSMR